MVSVAVFFVSVLIESGHKYVVGMFSTHSMVYAASKDREAWFLAHELWQPLGGDFRAEKR
jgi:hypothetical protein